MNSDTIGVERLTVAFECYTIGYIIMSYPRMNVPADDWFNDNNTQTMQHTQYQQSQQQYPQQQYNGQYNAPYIPQQQQPSYPQHIQPQPPQQQYNQYSQQMQSQHTQQQHPSQQPQIFQPQFPSPQPHQPQQQSYAPYNNSSTSDNNFFSSPMATVGMQFGQQFMQSDRFQSTMNKVSSFSIKYYFAVDNSYVINKLKILLLPFIHKQWSRKIYDNNDMYNSNAAQPSSITNYRYPRDDINAPDLYIPLMALVTHTLLISYARGMSGTFSPELIGMTASTTIIVLLLEVLSLKAGLWLIATNYELTPSILDLISYTSYKYVHWIIMLCVSLITNNTIIFYCSVIVFGCFSAFFIMRTLGRSLVRHNTSNSQYGDGDTVAAGTNRRNTFLLFTGLAQLLITFMLVRKAI